MKRQSYLLLQISLIFLFIAQIQCRKLVYVQQIFRHGARYPIKSMENDFSNFNQSQHGELTSQGKHMQYILGKAMYDKYWKDLFGETQYRNRYDHSQIYVRSTNINRTIQSAQCQIQGLLQKIPPLELPIKQLNFSFPPFAGSAKYQQQLKNDTVFPVFGSANRNFHPVPIHTEKALDIPQNQKYKYISNPYDQGDFLIKFDFRNCPNQKFWSKQNWATQTGMKIKNSKKVKNFLSQLSKAVSTQVQFGESYRYIDDYQCELHLGKPYLSLFDNKEYLKTSNFIMITSAVLSFFFSEQQIKSSNTQLLQNTLFRMKQAKNSKGPRLVLFSAHDTTILSVLSAFNMTNIPCIMDYFFENKNNTDTCISEYPQFGSNIVLQLWEQDNLAHTVKILYNGILRKIPICNYEYFCTFAQFQQWENNFFLDSPNEKCGIREQYTKLYLVIGVLSLFILIFAIIEMSKQVKKKIQQKMQKLQQKKGFIQNFEEKQGDILQLGAK